MSEKKPENPEAFPVPGSTYENPCMTLRDYFAAKAMQVLIEKYDGQDDCIDEIPAGAYEWAEAMLKAREAKP